MPYRKARSTRRGHQHDDGTDPECAEVDADANEARRSVSTIRARGQAGAAFVVSEELAPLAPTSVAAPQEGFLTRSPRMVCQRLWQGHHCGEPPSEQ